MDFFSKNKEFSKYFFRLARVHDTVVVFIDLLDITVAFFQYHGDAELGERLRKKYGNDYEDLCRLCFLLIASYENKVGDGMWADQLGNLYQEIVSTSKSSALGQFFTPQPICDFMAQIIIEKGVEGLTLNEPACGSGRMILAAHAIAPKNTFYGTDLDPICARMTAINMVLHQVPGQIVCANGLWYGDSWRFGYETYVVHFPVTTTLLRPITHAQCVQSNALYAKATNNKCVETTTTEREKVAQIEQKVAKIERQEMIQLSLF